MSEVVKFIDELNQAIYGDDWTMEKAQKLLQETCGVSTLMMGDLRSGQAVWRMDADGQVSRIAPSDFFDRPTSTHTG